LAAVPIFSVAELIFQELANFFKARLPSGVAAERETRDRMPSSPCRGRQLSGFASAVASSMPISSRSSSKWDDGRSESLRPGAQVFRIVAEEPASPSATVRADSRSRRR
jgi:hypothetical protein